MQRNGLTAALRELIKDIQSKHNVQIHLQILKEVIINKEKEIHVFRILQEIISNALKHANAKNIYISLHEKNSNLEVTVKDDGIGFDIEKTKEERCGLGLKLLESRIEILNGQMSFESLPNKGTSYFFKAPL